MMSPRNGTRPMPDMKIVRSTLSRVCVAVTVGMVVLAGCSNGDDLNASQEGRSGERSGAWENHLERDLAEMRQWQPAYYICWDGSNSSAVGQSGACSWHGGVGQVIYQHRRTGRLATASCVASTACRHNAIEGGE